MITRQSFAVRQTIAVTLITLLIVLFASVKAQATNLGPLNVSIINVGKGDAALLQDTNGYTVLIDGGPAETADAYMQYLRLRGVKTVDVMVVTHPHNDHYEGLIQVLQANDIQVKALVQNEYAANWFYPSWSDFQAAASARQLTPTIARFPDTYRWGQMTAQVLHPISGTGSFDQNPTSLVLKITHGSVTFLFTGDIDKTGEAAILARGTPVAADILKVAHHGDGASSSASFVQAVHPKDSVITIGDGREPDPGAVQRLLNTGTTVWRTDRDGTILIVSDGRSYTISSVSIRNLFIPIALHQ